MIPIEPKVIASIAIFPVSLAPRFNESNEINNEGINIILQQLYKNLLTKIKSNILMLLKIEISGITQPAILNK